MDINKKMYQTLKQVMVKLQGTKNLLVDGKIIPAHNKVIGISNKISNVLNQIQFISNQEQKSEENK